MTTAPTFRPMLATAGAPRSWNGWVIEPKLDGYRLQLAAGPDGVRATTRRGRTVTASLPELHPLAGALGVRSVVLDGELVAASLDFYALAGRLAATSPRAIREAAARAPVVLMAFDVLWLDGEPLIDRPWEARREALEALHLDGPAWHTVPVFEPSDDVLAVCDRMHLEGIVAKHRNGRYRAGVRSKRWLKAKTDHWRHVESSRRMPAQFRR